ncbi:MAG: hypothetical protein ING75_16935 [Rhodocyclaceae bacterium]|nr:hypothetical protein [Rhodocyclaceae bacterium]
MSNDKATLTKRLNGLAEVLTGTTNYSKYAHTAYEASAKMSLAIVERGKAGIISRAKPIPQPETP